MFLHTLMDAMADHREQTITYKGKTQTYAAMHADIEQMKDFFIQQGLQGRTVLLLGGNSYDWVVLHFALMLSGNAIVLVDDKADEQHLRDMFTHADADVVFSANRVLEGLLTYSYEDIRGGSRIEGLDERRAKKNDKIVYLGTSGTTGKSKIVALSEKNIGTNLFDINQYITLLGTSYIVLPLSHIFGLVMNLYLTLLQGKSIIIAEHLTELPHVIKEHGIQELFCVPAIAKMLERIIDQTSKKRALGEQFTAVYVSGAALSTENRDTLNTYGIHVYTGYGSTETSPGISLETDGYLKRGTVGKVLPSVELKVMDVKDGVGEIWVKGPSVITEYYYSAEDTSDVFVDGWYRTGDLGFLEDEFLTLTGRVKNLIILDNGKNVSPEKLEAFFVDNVRTIQEALVFAADDKIVLEVFLGDDIDPKTREATTKFIMIVNKELASYERIHKVVYREQPFPKTNAHKIVRSYKEIK